MGRARRSHSMCLPILLIAVVIQGILPDAHDLASLRALNLVCMLLPLDLNFSSDNDEPSEEACGEVRSGITVEMRELVQKLAVIGIDLSGPTRLMIGPGNSRCPSKDGAVPRFDDLINFLCRRIC
jgi:hypothetical protein